MYRTLDPDRIIATIVALNERVAARFPSSGLNKVCGELIQVARETEARVNATARPYRNPPSRLPARWKTRD